jgi:hypothetical protein
MNGTNLKRVAGGIVLGGKKKKKAVTTATVSGSSVPSILKSVPPRVAEDIPPPNNNAAAANGCDDEFEKLLSAYDGEEIPSDVLLCLQSYTQSSMGMTAESCAYCPIFASKNDGGHQSSGNNNNQKVCTHAAPFLPKSVLLHILDTDSSLSSSSSSSSRMQTEQDIKSLASNNKIRLLQLHGTAITSTTTTTTSSSFKDSEFEFAKFSNRGVIGLRGDGNDDDDIAIMEIIAFEIAVKLAIQSHASTLSQEKKQTTSCFDDVDGICDWFLKQLVPYYAGKTWIPSSDLNSFIQSYRVKEYWSVNRMKELINEFTLAGLFLPRRGLGGSRMEGYWFSLPGLGNASKSIADGRVTMLRKLRSCKYQEKKRPILEREHGQFKDGSDDSLGLATSSWGSSKKKTCIQQSGKFVVLDLLAKGLVVLKKTSSGEHFITLPK